MPTWFDTTLRFTGLTPNVVLQGSSAIKSESVIAVEGGYRQHFGNTLSFDATAFVNSYDHLRTQELTPPLGLPVTLGNKFFGSTNGLELSADYQPLRFWQLHAGYAFLNEDLRLRPDSTDITQGVSEYNDPSHQGWFRSYLDLPGHIQVDATVRVVGPLPHPALPGYAELTLRLSHQVSRTFEATLVGENLLHASHVEAGVPALRQAFPRAVFAQLTWRR
jgi:iron complex outermembrane receptor protein